MKDELPAPHGYNTYHCNHCGHQITVPIHCGSRLCVQCNYARAHRIRRRVAWILTHIQRTPRAFWKHITLTVRNTEDLDNRLDHLVSSFRRLRSSGLWKNTQFFGFYVIEITRSSAGWHPHLHIISYGFWIDWKKLLNKWAVITTDSHHIHVNPISQGTNIADYVSRYVSKTPALSSAHTKIADDCTRGRRLFSPFGQAAELLRKHKMPKFKTTCTKCGHCEWIPEWMLRQWERHPEYYPSPPP